MLEQRTATPANHLENLTSTDFLARERRDRSRSDTAWSNRKGGRCRPVGDRLDRNAC